MKDYVEVSDIHKHKKRHNDSLASLLDKFSFTYIFGLWLLIIVAFGVVYFFMHNSSSYLFSPLNNNSPITHIGDYVYYSFVTATTMGFGDILPKGFFKLMSVIEVVFGMLLIALVTSKLVSVKQDIILNEMYDLSISDKINRLRSSLLLFRQNLERIMTKIDDNTLTKREVLSLHIYISSLEDSLNETYILTGKNHKHDFIKGIDPVNAELVFNSVISSYEKMNELITLLDSKKIEWVTDLNKDLLNKCFAITDKSFKRLDEEELVRKETVKDLKTRKERVINNIMIVIKIKESAQKESKEAKPQVKA